MSTAKLLLVRRLYEFGPFRLDTEKRVLTAKGQPISIAPKALDVLIVLVESHGQLVEKEVLIKTVWPDTFVEENNLAFNVSVLRRLLQENSPEVSYIDTVPKRGYRFIGKVTEVVASDRDQASPQLAIARQTSDRAWLVACGILALAAIAGSMYSLHKSARLSQQDVIVIANFVNSTGDPVFDGTLHQGLAVAIGQSAVFQVIGDEQIRRTLPLMKQPAEARLTPDLSRELCQRVGGTVLLDGSIASVGSAYVLGLRAESCMTGKMLDNEQMQIQRKEDVLAALGEIVRRFRKRAGESAEVLAQHDKPLPETTTSSLEALKAYATAWQLHASRGAMTSLPFFQRAVELDPDFAMGHASLGRAYADLDQPDLAATSLRKAWLLRERTSDREKFFISTTYEMLTTGNMERARLLCEAWEKSYSRDPVPQSLLSGMVNKTMGRFREAEAHARAVIGIDPGFWVGYYNAAVNSAYLEDFRAAETDLHLAAKRGVTADEFLMLSYDLAFLQDDRGKLAEIAARARGKGERANWITAREASALAYSGHWLESLRLSQQAMAQARAASQEERASLWAAAAAVRAALFGKTHEAKENAAAALVLSKDRDVVYGAALASAIAGDRKQANVLAEELSRRFPEDTSVRFSYIPVLRAQLALRAGEPEKAIRELEVTAVTERGLPWAAVSGLFGALYPFYLRGEAYLTLHRGADAARQFEEILDHRGIVVSDPIGALARLQLGRAYIMAGDKVKARNAYQDFLQLWKDADAGIPIYEQAKRDAAHVM